MIYGDSLRNNVVAVASVEEPEVKAWAAENGKAGTSVKELCNDPALKKAVSAQLMALATSNKFSSLEKPREIHLTEEPFSVENNLLTPTFKLKRNIGKVYY